MEELLALLKDYNNHTSELMSFEVFTDKSGAIYSHYQGEEMKKHRWISHFTSIEDAIVIMKTKITFVLN